MADINIPQAKKWSNEKCRPIANKVINLLNSINAMDAEWVGQNVQQYFPVGGDNIIDDAETDGRPINTRDNVHNIAANIQTLRTNIEALKAPFLLISRTQI